MGLGRGRVDGDEHGGRIARGLDRGRAEVDMERRNANSVPCGARISAGKSGKVARSLPANAVDKVNWPPVNCIPSPLSPAKRTTTDSDGGWAFASSGVT